MFFFVIVDLAKVLSTTLCSQERAEKPKTDKEQSVKPQQTHLSHVLDGSQLNFNFVIFKKTVYDKQVNKINIISHKLLVKTQVFLL